MRRRSRLINRLGSVALAYLLALHALLGAWAGHAGGLPGAFDPALTLCQAASTGETQKSDGDKGTPAHCVVMCLSGACGNGNPPATIAAAVEPPLQRTDAIALRAVSDGVVAAVRHVALNARGPPSIG